jgi:hypothetical protein
VRKKGKMGINGKLELVCAHKYGYYEQVMTQLAFSEEKSDIVLILVAWTYTSIAHQMVLVNL